MLGANLRAVANRRATPDAVLSVEHLHPQPPSAIARIGVVAMQQREHARTGEIRVQAELRACGVAQHAVDARCVLLDFFEFFGRLKIFALRQRPRFFRNQVGVYALELLDESIHADHKIAFDGEVRQRFDAHGSGCQIPQECLARQRRDPVDHHSAASANRHAARPAKTQAAVDVILDLLQPLQHGHIVGVRDREGFPNRLAFLLGPKAHHLDLDRFGVVRHDGPPRLRSFVPRRRPFRRQLRRRESPVAIL